MSTEPNNQDASAIEDVSVPEPPTGSSWEALELVEDPDRGRFNLLDGETYVGFVGYTIDPHGVVLLQHTIIAEKYSRRGYARALVTLVLDTLRERGLTISAQCSYVVDYLERFPQYRGMEAASNE